MKGDTEVVLMIVFFFAGAALMAYARELSVIPYLEHVSGALATLVAAFVGAWYAFKLQAAHLEKVKTKELVSAGNKAIFELGRTFNQFLAIKNQFIEEHRNNPARHILIMPMAGGLHHLQLDFDSLAFLFESKDQNLLGRLAMFEQEVASTLSVIEQRSHLHVEVVQPTVEELEKKVGSPMSVAQMDKELGQRNAQTMRILTDLMVEGVDRIVGAAHDHTDEIHRMLKEKFPGHSVIALTVPNKSIQPSPKDGADNV